MVPAGGGQRYFLGSRSHTSGLGPGESYSVSTDISLNQAQSTGTYDVTLQVDSGGYVFEHTSTQNNLQMAALNIVQRLPDLEVKNIQTTVEIDLVTERSNVKVSWEVQNVGQGQTRSRTWYDAVYISDTADQWAGLRLGTNTYSNPDSDLLSQASYIVTQKEFPLPLQQYGTKFIHVYVDHTNRQVEATEDIDTNIKEVEITIPVRSSQLGVTHSVISTSSSTDTTTVFAGKNVTITWNVTNNGNWTTDGSRWTDIIYLSKVDFVDNTAHKLGQVEYNREVLKPGHEYQSQFQTTIPDDITGEIYILVAIGDGLWEYQDDSDRLFSVPVVAEEPPRPELRIQSIRTTKLDSQVAQRQDSSGQLLEVTWTGINIGKYSPSKLLHSLSFCKIVAKNLFLMTLFFNIKKL